MVRPVGFEPTKTASYTHRPVPSLDYGSNGSFANLLTATIKLYTLLLIKTNKMLPDLDHNINFFYNYNFITRKKNEKNSYVHFCCY